jgi:predicted phage terminase large subunit-like protein
MRRQLLESEWFQQRWGGDFTIGAGQDMKSQFDNSRGGQMIATSVGATVTGKGGDTLIVDDPTSADEALSDAMRANANHWFDNTLRSRLNDPATGAIVVIMQRLHEQDLTGFLLETEPGVWTHLRIPLVEDLFTTEDAKDTEEIQSNCHSLLAPLAGEESMQSSCPSSTSSDDVASCESLAVRTKSPGGAEDVSPGRMPRPLRQESGVGSPPGTESRRDDRKGRYYPFPVSEVDYFRETGDILQPERFTPEVVERLKARGLVFAGQYQQLPAPMEGNLIKRSQVRYYGGVDPASGAPDEALPEKFDREIISVDCAFKDHADSDFVALGRIGVKGRKHYVLNVVNAHLGMGGTEEAIRRELSGRRVAAVLIEDKANGTAVIERLKANVNGVIPVNPEGGKLARFMAMQPEWEAGDWYVARNAAWTPALIEQLVTFPSARHDDMCDMLSQAAIWLGKAKTGPENWLKYWRENGPGAKKKVQPTPWWDGERFY